METNIGLIRDKPGIYSGLWQSKSSHQQLAVCYNHEGKLLVKICIVKELTRTQSDTMVTLTSPDHESEEISIPFTAIESIYPIRDFVK